MNRSALILFLLLLTALLVPAATVTPTASLLVDGEPWDVTAGWRPLLDGKLWLGEWGTDSTESPLQSLVVLGDTDPFLAYAVGFINPFAVTTSFQLTITMPYVGGPYNHMLLSHASTITDGNRSGDATASLFLQPNIANGHLDGTVVTGVSTGCTISSPTISDSCYNGPASSVAVASGVSGNFGLVLSFNLTPGDAYSASGLVTLDKISGDDPVPEPATMALTGIGLTLVGLYGRRRWSSR